MTMNMKWDSIAKRHRRENSIDVTFCRSLLSEVRKEIKVSYPHIRTNKDAWVWCAGRDHWEFHGPGEYYWHGRAGNAYDARYKGWMAWLQAERKGSALTNEIKKVEWK